MPKWLKIVLIAVGALVAVVAALFFVGKARIGTRYEHSAKEGVYYSGDATEADARAVADKMKQLGYFDGSMTRDVQVRKESGNTIISFVLGDGQWDQPGVPEQLRAWGRDAALAVGGLPATVRLVDEKLVTKKEMKVE